MRLLTYLLAAALLWAVATSGPPVAHDPGRDAAPAQPVRAASAR